MKTTSTAQHSTLRNGILRSKIGVNDISLRVREISDGKYAITASKLPPVDKRVPTDLASLLQGINSYGSLYGNASPQALLVAAAKVVTFSLPKD
jgi:hypothetical protein